MHKVLQSLLFVLAIMLVAAAHLQAQPSVLTNGIPDDPALFDLSTIDTINGDFVNDPASMQIVQTTVTPTGPNDGFFFAIGLLFNESIHNLELNIENGGDTPGQLSFVNSEVNVLGGGEIGGSIAFGAGSFLNASSGSIIGSNTDIFGTANLNGGSIGGAFESFAGSTVNISGNAAFTGSLNELDGTVNISGGTISSSTDFNESSNVTVTGGTFGNNMDFRGTANLTGGTLGQAGRIFGDVTIGGDVVFDRNWDILEGSNVTFVGDNFTVGPGVEFFEDVTINGGTFLNSADFEAGTTSVINGGSFGVNVDVNGDLTINDGTFSNNLDIGSNAGTGSIANVTINGGTISDLDIDNGVVTVNGGDIGDLVVIDRNGTLNLTASGFEDSRILASEGDVNLLGTEFCINGNAISGSSVVATEGSVLTGTLDDGSFVEFDLYSTGIVVDSFHTRDFFGGSLIAGGTSISIVAEPLLGDVNLDGEVDFLDIASFIAVLTAGGNQLEADIDQSGLVDFLDISPFIDLLTN